jgi:hypothetical protein
VVERSGHGVQIVVEEVGVRVEGHRGGRVPKHPLDRLYMSAGRHGEARGRVAEFVRREPAARIPTPHTQQHCARGWDARERRNDRDG